MQRQVTTLQVELENAKRSNERAASLKKGREDTEVDEYKSQIEELKKELKDAKSASKQLSTLESSLASSREEIATLKASLAKTRSATEKDTVSKSDLEILRKELATEKKERARVEKALEKETAGHEARTATLEDKLASFRSKLKSTKEKLKETEAELEHVRSTATATTTNTDTTANGNGAAKNSKTSKKREASVDPDAMLGTPGDHAPAKKRGRQNKTMTTASLVGDKSTFSITPFLNRTMSLAPASDGSAKKRKASEVEEGDAEGGAELEVEAPTPSAAAGGKKAGRKEKEKEKKPKALAPASSAKTNSNGKPASKRAKAAVSTLEKVTEESEVVESPKKAIPAVPAEKDTTTEDVYASNENATSNDKTYAEKKTTTSIPLGTTLVPKQKAVNKPRKSLLSFAAFTEDTEPAAAKPTKEKKTKRKLLGGKAGNSSILGGKTLFDEEDEAEVGGRGKPVPGRGLFAKRSLLGGVGGGKKGLGGLGGSVEESGFVFSPLKKDRRAMALAQSMLGN